VAKIVKPDGRTVGVEGGVGDGNEWLSEGNQWWTIVSGGTADGQLVEDLSGRRSGGQWWWTVEWTRQREYSEMGRHRSQVKQTWRTNGGMKKPGVIRS